jgi:hypothetical protein
VNKLIFEMAMKSDNKLVGNLLTCGRGTLSILHRKVAQLDKLTALLKNSLNDPLRQHCQVANLKDDCLVIMVDSAAWATQIRYLTPDLLKQLKRSPELQHVRTLHCYIDPGPTPSAPAPIIEREPLSADNIQLFNSMGNSRDDELGKALKRLAEHAQLKR